MMLIKVTRGLTRLIIVISSLPHGYFFPDEKLIINKSGFIE